MGYYADAEDAYYMQRMLEPGRKKKEELVVEVEKKEKEKEEEAKAEKPEEKKEEENDEDDEDACPAFHRSMQRVVCAAIYHRREHSAPESWSRRLAWASALLSFASCR